MADQDKTSVGLTEYLNKRLKPENLLDKYSYARCLVVHWEDGDHVDGFRKEARDFGELMRGAFGYDTTHFAIPATQSLLRLQSVVTSSILETCEHQNQGQGPCLLIIHYGGHGDSNDDRARGEDRRAVWAAYANGGPTLEWFRIQDTLGDAGIDVLIFLDCCYSAQAGRARDTHPKRVELLAAASMREQTPLPGPRSFTAGLIREIKSSLDEKGQVSISELHTRLAHREAKLYTTPFHIKLQQGTLERSIRLKPLCDQKNNFQGLQEQMEKSSLRRVVHTRDNLEQSQLDRIAAWLNSDVPETVLRLKAESVLSVTANINGFVHELSDSQKSFVRALDETAVAEILDAWNGIVTLIEHHSQNNSSKPQLHNSLSKIRQSAEGFIEKLGAENTHFTETVEKHVLQSSYREPDALLDAIENPVSELLGIKDQLVLRHLIISFGPNKLSANPQSKSGAPVLQEYKVYGDNHSPADIAEMKNRVALLAGLLGATKSRAFSSLRCSNWFHEAEQYRFVYQFEVPPGYKTGPRDHQTLQSLITNARTRERPSLGEKLRMALLLAKAVAKWHSIGWVHQGISSHNVVFLEKMDGGADYLSPFLQGFEFARLGLAPSLGRYVDKPEFNVYRHPDRQGLARQGHQKTHDFYSLGVVLLEIGLWQRAIEMVVDPRKKEQGLTVRSMQERLLAPLSDHRLAYYAGKDYEEAVRTCMTGDFGVDMDDRAESQLARAFEEKVISKLEKGREIR